MNLRRLPLLGLVALLLSACGGLPPASEPPAPTQTALPTPTSLPLSTPEAPKRVLTICAGSEPADLFLYNETGLVKQAILSALYDGPIDSFDGAYRPVILEKLPSLADGDALIEAVEVRPDDLVMDADGKLSPLQPGLLVRPAGCRSGACAITYESGSLQMDRLRVLFHLRQGIFWEDGEPVTAWDSAFSYRIASDPETLYGNLGLVTASAASLVFTANYSALDDFTVQWTGVPGFLDPNYLLNFFHPLPEHILTAYTLPDLLASNEALYRPTAWGAYRLAEWEAGVQIRLEPNPAYFRRDEGLPAFDELIIRFVGQDVEANLAELRAGTCDLLLPDALPETLTPPLLEMVNAGAARLLPDPQPVFEHLVFDLAPADLALPPLFADVRTRRAAAACLDRALLADAVYAGFVPALQYLLPAGHPLLEGISWASPPLGSDAGTALLEEIGWRDTDGDGIREAYGVAGVPDGTRLQFTLVSTDAPLRDQVGRWITFQLQACGMDVSVEQYPARDLLAQTADSLLSGRKFQLAEVSAPLGVESLCALGVSEHISSEANGWSGANLGGYSSPQFDSACAAALASLPGEPDYVSSRQEVLRLLSEDLPILPLFVQTRFLLAAPGLAGSELPGGMQNLESFQLEP